MPQHIFTSRPNKHGQTLVLDTATMIATIEDPSETPNEWTRIQLHHLKKPDHSDPRAEDQKKEIEQFVPQSYMESLEYSDYFGEQVLCLINAANPSKIMSFDVSYEDDNDEPGDLTQHLQSTLHALHTRINALHARVHHGVTRFDVYSLAGIDKRIRYLQNEIRILKNLGRVMGHTNYAAIKWCEDEIAHLLQIRPHRVSSGLSTHATGSAHTIKVALNERCTGFRVSPEGIRLYESLSGKPFPDHGFHHHYDHQYRTDPYLIQVIETLKDRASADDAKLVITEIPSDINWHIHSSDGYESIYKTVDGTDYEFTFDGRWRDTSEDDPNDDL